MTRLAVLADIHGNLPALEAVCADMVQFEVDHVVVAGDLINRGPFSVEVVEYVLERRWSAIRGNHEYYLLDYQSDRMPEAWQRFTTPKWLKQQVQGQLYAILACLPDELQLRFADAPPVRVCHGVPGDPWNAIYKETSADEVRSLLAGVDETTILCAHNHIPMDINVDKWHIINPGTVGAPFDGSTDASYVILDGDTSGWQATFRRVPCDYTSIFEAFERMNFVEQMGAFGLLMIEELRRAYPLMYMFRLWMNDNYPGEADTDERIYEFLSQDSAAFLPERYK